MKAILKAERLNKYFYDPEEFHVIKDISFSVYESEFVSLIGKSGCGKSTLMYLIATLDTEYEGSIEINSTKVTGMTQNQLAKFRNEHIGFVFQFHFLLPEFTVLQNVMMPAIKLKKLDAKTIEYNAIEKLRQMGMEKFAFKLAPKLSNGQQQRVAIARALINNPKIIMADEPTGNLDSMNTAIIFEILMSLAKQGNTIITVTHDNDFATKTNRIIEMADGQIGKPGGIDHPIRFK